MQTKQWLEQILKDAGLNENPFTAETQLATGEYGEPTDKVLKAIGMLKTIVLFDAFGSDPRFKEGGEQ